MFRAQGVDHPTIVIKPSQWTTIGVGEANLEGKKVSETWAMGRCGSSNNVLGGCPDSDIAPPRLSRIFGKSISGPSTNRYMPVWDGFRGPDSTIRMIAEGLRSALMIS